MLMTALKEALMQALAVSLRAFALHRFGGTGHRPQACILKSMGIGWAGIGTGDL
jgi:hypothetical protein